MEQRSSDEFKKLLRKYERRLTEDFGLTKDSVLQTRGGLTSREYLEFKKEYLPKHHTLYEKLCNFSEKIISIKPGAKREESLRESIDISHLNVTPAGIMSASVLIGFFVLMTGLLFSVLFGSKFFMMFSVLTALFIIIAFEKTPGTMANSWRLKSSNQMVLCIFYVVTYMRHTSNLERAVAFAAEHLRPPLALDMKRILWNVETERFASIKESLDNYLETWRKWNMEFIEAFHLVEASLYESSEDRRLNLIERGLEVMLEETYEKMLHYAHNLKSPITMLHMLGVILPILGLVILPLVVNFMGGVKWYHVAVLYNIILPFIVFYMGRNILSERPTGYGDVDISEENPALKKYRNIIIRLGPAEIKINPLWFSIIIFCVLLLIGIFPVFLHMIDPNIGTCFSKEECNDFTFLSHNLYFLEYRKSIEPTTAGKIVGPFGVGAGILSISVTLAFGLGIGMYYKLRSQNVIKLREKSKQLEAEFASALFQLGNRIGDGIPVEIAFGKVARIMEGTRSGEFFELVSSNITHMGQNVEEAIFNPRTGALVYYPSSIIESSMKVLIVSAKKGPMIASQAVINVSRYIKEIHKVDERLKDLLADIIASMKSQISFLAPAIAGVVIGITSMVTTIMGQLGTQMAAMQQSTMGGAADQGMNLMIFSDGIPTYHFQIIVGIYVVQIVYVLTILANGIENGSDSLNERYLLGTNLVRSTILYSILAFLVILIFNVVAGSVLTGVGGVTGA